MTGGTALWARALRTCDLERIFTATVDRRTADEARWEMDYRDDRACFLGPVAFEPFLLGRKP